MTPPLAVRLPGGIPTPWSDTRDSIPWRRRVTFELRLALVGVVVGTLVGLTGMGGGALMTPILVLLGLPPTTAIGTDLAHAAITKTLGALRHRQLGNVDLPIAGWLAVGSVPASVVGVLIVDRLQRQLGDDAQGVIRTALAVAVIAAGVVTVLRAAGLLAAPVIEERPPLTGRTRALTIVAGAVVGLIVGITSVGSGTLCAVVLLYLFRLPASRIVGTDIAHAALLVFTAAAAHALITHTVEPGTVGWLLVGSLPGTLIGAQMTLGASDRAIRIAMAIVLVAAGIALLS